MLQHIDSVLNAIGSNPPPRIANGVVGAFWDVAVAIPRVPVDPIEALFTYARTQSYEAEIAGGVISGRAHVVPPLYPGPECLGVSIVFESAVLRNPFSKIIDIPYPTPQIGALCRGEWCRFGRLHIQAPSGSLWPEISTQTLRDEISLVQLRWPQPWQCELAPTNVFSRLMRRQTRFELLGLDITRAGATLIVHGPAKLFLPTLTWS